MATLTIPNIPATLAAWLPATFTAPGLNEEQFLALCEKFPDCLLEYTVDGTVIIMPPTDPDSSKRVTEVVGQLWTWARLHGGGVIGPDGGFFFRKGSRRSPDATWFDEKRWQAAKTPGLYFPVFAPEFVIEVRSPYDRINTLREKMEEYVDSGVSLAWLVDPKEHTVTIYRPGRSPEVLMNPRTVAGEGPVAGFVLELDRVL